MRTRKIIIGDAVILCVIITFTAICDILVSKNASGKIYDNADSIPYRKVGLILD